MMFSTAVLPLVNTLFSHHLTESDLPGTTAHLPMLDEQSLVDLIRQADATGRTHPWQGWAMMMVVDAAQPTPLPQNTSPRCLAFGVSAIRRQGGIKYG